MSIRISYRVGFGLESIKKKIPLSIARMINDNNSSTVEYCNEAHGWIEDTDKISMWMGSSDDGYFSPPDGDEMPQEFIDEWISKWSKNWTKDSLKQKED